MHYTAPQLFPDDNHLGTIPRVTDWRGVAGRPANINWLDRWGEVGNDYIRPSFADNLSINRGAHSHKVGLYFEHMRNGEAAGGNWSGSFSFRSNESSYTAALGNTSYAYANALIGNFRSYNESSSRPFTNLEITLLQWYAQDQWKVNRRLTVNYGLRMGYHSQWRQRDGKASNFDPTRYDPAKAPLLYQPFCVGPPTGTACATANQRAMDPRTGQLFTNANLVRSFVPGTGDPNNGLVLASDPTTPSGFKEVQPIDWEPRVGFAWDVFGKGKTVLRAMGGVYHSPRIGGGTTGGNLVNNAPQQRTLTFSNGNIKNLVNLIGTSLNFPTALNAVEVHTNTPTTYNFSLGVQQDIGFKTVMEISYVGSLSRHLGEKRNINGVPDTARFFDCTVVPANVCHPENRDPFSTNSAKNDDFFRRYQGFGDINMVMYSGTSNYNGLQVQVNRRYTRGFQYGIAYTWSKTFDYANDDSSDVNASRPYRQFNYVPADFDQTHIFTANYIWELPSLGRRLNNGFAKAVFDGWVISGTTSLVSGKPKSVSVTYNSGTVTATGLPAITDFTGGEVNARPIMICNPNRRTGQVTATGIPVVIDTSCFVKPGARGDIGNTPRNVLRLPGVVNLDLAFFKNFRLGEKLGVQFRWETYNLFNHTNFRDIDATVVFDANGVQPSTSTFGVPASARSPRVMQGSLRFSF